MSRNTARAAAVLAIAALIAGHFAFNAWYRTPIAEINQQRDALQSRIQSAQSDSNQLFNQLARDDTQPTHALGTDADRVNLNIRRILTTLSRQHGAQEPRVDTRPRGAVVNPASTERLDEFREGRSRRTIASFNLVEATLTTNIRTQDAYALATAIISQPLPWRITQWRLQARQDAPATLRVSIEATWRTDDTRPILDIPIAPANSNSTEHDAIARAFTIYTPPEPDPPAPQPVAQPAPQPAPPPGPPPLSLWKLTAIAELASGPEMWIVNTQTSEQRILTPGDQVHTLSFVRPIGPDALVTVDGKQRLIKIGQPLNRSESQPTDRIN